MRDLFLIAVVVVCSLIALRRPVFGILAFVSLGFLHLNTMTWTIGRTFPFAQFIGIGTILGYVFWPERKKFPHQREWFLIVALWCIFGISTFFAIYPEIAFERFIYVSKMFLMVFLVTSIISSEGRLHLLLYAIALSLGFFGLKGGVFVILTGGNYQVLGPEESFIGSNNAIGLALSMNIPFLFYLSKMETRSWLRWIMKLMLVFSYPAVVCTYSRGAWVGLAMVTAFLVLKSKFKFLLVPAVIIIGIIALPYLPRFLPQRIFDRYDALRNYQEEGSAQSRLWNWEFSKRVAMANPLHGGGFDFYSEETYAKYFPEFLERWPEKVWSSHSIWFTMLGEHGFPGIFLWVILIGFCFVSLRQVRLYGKAHPETPWFTYYADMVQASLVAYTVVGTFYDAAYFDLFYYLVAVIIIIKEIILQPGFEPSL